ncbi:P-loop containing nucleoside triphosphate hydrolase protein [Cantharellus anzutake]|uniref:P-loop containing nucleoside triphosphate hydrolase protein n=1 Tax=Cantharellus anzutake TaxID=1750568 RepID=UPI00190301AB|nr:P-loop containing nucleoside triphosphate hydrolase protein [Cantharellus anzutake]KAF8332625.1 P-loop containing nucleoside triphosphate hydrolase protein [Cantharellus anzutake]
MIRATRSSLGKRSSSAIVSSPPPSPAPLKRAKTSASVVILPDGSYANKENIPPAPEPVERDALTRSPRLRVARQSSLRRESSSDVRMDNITTPPHTPTHSDSTSGDADRSDGLPRIPAPVFTPLKTPSRAMGALSLATPPSTPPPSLHSRARALLRSTSDADVVGRETERQIILDFLGPFLDPTAGPRSLATSLYASGKPGTGKTALVSSILASIPPDVGKSAYINCMGLKDLSLLWERVLMALGGSGSSKSRASSSSLQRLECALEREGTKCVLVLDELDAFGPAGLSAIFALPHRHVSTLRVIAISNDLIQSTSFTHRPSLALSFPAYSAADMQAIIRGRLSKLSAGDDSDASTQLIHPPALTLLVKKAAMHTGDIRYALEVLRRAIDLAAQEKAAKADCNGQVAMKHILDAFKSASTSRANPVATTSGRSPLDGCIGVLGLHARLALISVLLSHRRSSHNLSLEDISLSSVISDPFATPKSKSKLRRSVSQSSDSPTSPSRVYSLYTQIVSTPSSKFDPVSRSEFSDLLGVLETSSLISLPVTALASPSKSGRRSSRSSFCAPTIGAGPGDISLSVAEDEVLRAVLTKCGEGNVLEQEIGSIWERELKRIQQSLKRRGELKEEEKLAPEDYLS